MFTQPNQNPRRTVTLRCVRCGQPAIGFSCRCAACDGLVDPFYGTPFSPVVGATDLVGRYWTSLPLLDRASARLPIPSTPLVELESLHGVRIFAKVEGVLPTASTKDRLAAIALPFMLEQGVRKFAFSSTGNTAAAYAHALFQYPELRARLYMSDSVDQATVGPVPSNLEIVRVSGDYVEAGARARRSVDEGYVVEGGFFNIGRREGAKLAYLEAIEQLNALGIAASAIVQAVASGLGIYAAARAIDELRDAALLPREPRLFCAQQATCAPMVQAFRAEQRGQTDRLVLLDPRGIAPAMLLGNPFASYDYVAEVVRASGGDFIAPSDHEVEAVLASHRRDDVPIGASAAVGLAAAHALCRRGSVSEGDSLLVMTTGGPGR